MADMRINENGKATFPFPKPCIIVYQDEMGCVIRVDADPPIDHEVFIIDESEAADLGLNDDAYREWVIAGRPELREYQLSRKSIEMRRVRFGQN